ncbi:MAG: hypothetical protein K8L91_19905 [Anaerolineae bacterium]|nr:hypothetical protein [Anaerolineae bacterium]
MTEVRSDGVYVRNGLKLSRKTKHYRREEIQGFEVRRWRSEIEIGYVWPFRSRAHITNSRTRNFGVRLTLHNRRKVFIETHRPSEFIFAIDQMMRQEFRPPSPHPFDRYPPE